MHNCCQQLLNAILDESIKHQPDGYECYTISRGTILNYCPFCGKVLPGALVTDWELHEKCERCHWTGRRNDAKIPPCICSKNYEELKKIQDETHPSN